MRNRICATLVITGLFTGLSISLLSAQSADTMTDKKMSGKNMSRKGTMDMDKMSAEDKAAMVDKMSDKNKMAMMKMSGMGRGKPMQDQMDMMGKMSMQEKADMFDKMPMSKKKMMMHDGAMMKEKTMDKMDKKP